MVVEGLHHSRKEAVRFIRRERDLTRGLRLNLLQINAGSNQDFLGRDAWNNLFERLLLREGS